MIVLKNWNKQLMLFVARVTQFKGSCHPRSCLAALEFQPRAPEEAVLTQTSLNTRLCGYLHHPHSEMSRQHQSFFGGYSH